MMNGWGWFMFDRAGAIRLGLILVGMAAVWLPAAAGASAERLFEISLDGTAEELAEYAG